jgi:hypothetical protein
VLHPMLLLDRLDGGGAGGLQERVLFQAVGRVEDVVLLLLDGVVRGGGTGAVRVVLRRVDGRGGIAFSHLLL